MAPAPPTERSAVGRVPCRHCGLPVPGRRRVAEAASFCCTGCHVAHRLMGRDLAEGRTDRLLARIVLSAFLAMGVMVFSLSLYGEDLAAPEARGLDSDAALALRGLFRLGAMALSTPVLLLLGLPLWDAVVRLRRFLSADALILAGVLAAWAVSVWSTFAGGGAVYFETATMVLVLVSLGRWMDVRAKERARAALRAIAPEREAPVALLAAGGERAVEPASLRVGDVVRVRPGELVPVDGEVLEGRSFADTSALTGEAEPRSLGPGDRVLAGSALVDGSLVVRAEAVGGGRVRDEVERLLAEAAATRPGLVRLADRVAGALLPVVLVLAAATAVLRWRAAGPEDALLDALSVVLISCPCALGIATPLAFWVALGAAWRRGVLVRGGEVLERLARVRRLYLDKTGTLTSGDLALAAVRPRAGLDRREALRRAAALEHPSEHPIARALRRAAAAEGLRADLPAVEGFRVLPGIGVAGRMEGAEWTVRRPEPGELSPDRHGASGGDPTEGDPTEGATRVVLVREGAVRAELAFAAEPRPEAPAVVAALAARGLELAILTGDAPAAAEPLGRRLGLPVHAGLLPGDKVRLVERAGRAGTAYVGDGLNDAAVLAAAEVGITVAGSAPRSLEAAPVNVLRPGLAALPELLDLARAAVRVARGNLAWAFAYNAVGLGLAVSGRLTPVFAASAMVASSLLVVLNSGRLGAGGPERPRERAEEEVGERVGRGGAPTTVPRGPAPGVGRPIETPEARA